MEIRIHKRDESTREKKLPDSTASRLRDNSISIQASFDDNTSVQADIILTHDDILDLYLHAHRQHERHLKIF